MRDANLQQYNFKAGDQVVVRGWPPSAVMTVIDHSDRSLLILETPGGAQLKVGRLACALAANTESQ